MNLVEAIEQNLTGEANKILDEQIEKSKEKLKKINKTEEQTEE